jgi:hypothetical protein
MPVTTTSTDALTRVLPLPEVEAGLDLYFRRNDFNGVYRPVESLWHAGQLLGSGTFDSPWVTIIRGQPHDDHTYIQILGTPGRLIVEGGGSVYGFKWDWRATALPMEHKATTAGPDWYQADAIASEILAVHDARALLWPTLSDFRARLAQVGDLKSDGSSSSFAPDIAAEYLCTFGASTLETQRPCDDVDVR